jgi:hypothetical protein
VGELVREHPRRPRLERERAVIAGVADGVGQLGLERHTAA